jgi:hypothetical protein
MRVDNEEKMLPLVRSTVAKRLLQLGFRANQVSRVLNVTPAAVTQYLKGARGRRLTETEHQKRIIDALAEKAAQRINGNMEPLSAVELLDVAHQILTVTNGEKIIGSKSEGKGEKKGESIALLKVRLQLELKAAQRCLDLANHAKDEYTRLLLRMVASDSIRHADIVSQMILWLETEREVAYEPPDHELLDEILAIEDNANEFSLRKTVKIRHGVARLLLESIDMDEEKHERLIAKLAEKPSTS